jgi:hypothetical protein
MTTDLSSEVDGTVVGVCMMACFAFSAVEHLGSIALHLTSY